MIEWNNGDIWMEDGHPPSVLMLGYLRIPCRAGQVIAGKIR